MKIGFFEIKGWEADYLKTKLAGHQLVFDNSPLSSNYLPGVRDFEVISIFTDSRIDRSVIDAFPNLKLITTRTTGTDHIDQTTAKNRGVIIRNVPNYGEDTVAEYAFALLLSLSRKIVVAANRVKEKGQFSSEGLVGLDLKDKTIGIIGTGHIGQKVIKIANGFEMKVVACDAFPKSELTTQLNFKYVSFEDLLKTADIITLHVPYLPTTYHLINHNNLNLIKRGAILVNTSRGAVVETEAIVKALNEGVLAAAALDVLEEETSLKNEKQFILEKELDDADLRTIIEDHVLIGMDNVVITPHNAFNTKEALQKILDTTAQNILEL